MTSVGKLFGAMALLGPLVLLAEGLAPLNVRDFGAVGDGVHDDTLAIQKAANAAYPKPYAELRKARENLADLRTREVPGGTLDGPSPEIFFPRGDYLVTGPVLFNGAINLRGEDGAVIRNSRPTADTFYFDHGFRVRVENLAFVGGRTQLRPCSYNLSDATFFVCRCGFARSSGPAVRLGSYRLQDGTPNDEHRHHACSPYEISWTPEGRVKLVDRPESVLVGWYVSNFGTLENCTFTDCAQAFRFRSDVFAIRDCTVTSSVASDLPLAKIGGLAHLERVSFTVTGEGVGKDRPMILAQEHSVFTDCSFRSDRPMDALRHEGAACRYYCGSQVSFKDCRFDCAGGALTRFAEEAFPNVLTVDNLKGPESGARQRLFAFDREPTAKEVADWPAKHRMRDALPIGRCLGISLASVDPKRFDAFLPPSLTPFLRDCPDGLRERVKERPDYTLPSGPELTDGEIGSVTRSGAGRDDTARLQALFDRAASEKSATVVLPAAWIETKAPIRVCGNVHVLVRGRAVLKADDCGPAFRLAEGSRVVFENLVFHRGAHAVWCEGGRGHLLFRTCYLVDQLRESICAQRKSARVPGWRIEINGGVLETAHIFAGAAAPLFLNGTWLTLAPDRPYLKHRVSYAAIENGEFGEVVAQDICGVPRYFENKEVFTKTPGRVGDYRWIDNYGKVCTFQFRFGGERCGITSVYNHPGASTYVEGGNSYHKNNGHLRPLRAAAHLSSAKDDVKFVDVCGFNLMDDPAFYVGVQQDDGSYVNVHEDHVFNCYPFPSK